MARTIFIVGAGASREFGDSMPIGLQLARMIKAQLLDEISGGLVHRPITNALSFGGFGSQHRAAMNRIAEGIEGYESIDDMVDDWSDQQHLDEIAQMAISWALLRAEAATPWGQVASKHAQATTVLGDLRDTWLGQILRFHGSGKRRREFAERFSDVGFIVFNYDRLIEYHLYQHLRVTLNETPDSARAIISNIPIHHVYGTLGTLPELGGDHALGDSSDWLIAQAPNRIRTYTRTVDSVVGEQIAALVRNAEQIVFLGCAYHDQNLRILFPDGSPGLDDRRKVWGTVLGLRPNQRQKVETFFSSSVGTGRVWENATAAALMDAQRDWLLA
jgi:hypothetical protein